MIVLASASPRRANILAAAGIDFVKRPAANVDETPRPGEAPNCYVRRLAKLKAEAVPVNDGEVILAADTTVVVDGSILGKPEDAADAARMLRLLSGRSHEVLTGICLRSTPDRIIDAATTTVWFATLNEDEIAWYVDSGEPMDKAGAYGIQGLASRFVERIDGCYFNVMGLPVGLVYRRLRERSWYK